MTQCLPSNRSITKKTVFTFHESVKIGVKDFETKVNIWMKAKTNLRNWTAKFVSSHDEEKICCIVVVMPSSPFFKMPSPASALDSNLCRRRSGHKRWVWHCNVAYFSADLLVLVWPLNVNFVILSSDNTNLRASISVCLISCLFSLDSAALLMLKQQPCYLFGQI